MSIKQKTTALKLALSFAKQSTTPSKELQKIYATLDVAPHAFISLMQEQAMAQAKQADRRWQAGTPLSIFDGVPIAYKDLFDIKNTITTAGAKIRQHAPVAHQDAVQVAQLTRMGLIGVGKTNLSEFAYSGLGLNPHFGTPVNAINPDFIAGGSSSGSAVAVASGLVPLAMGTDTAGSIRIPSAFNGLVGHRATRGRYDMTGVFPLAESVDTTGAMTHSVKDCLLMDNLLHNQTSLEWLDDNHLPTFLDKSNPIFYIDPVLLNVCDDDVKQNFYTFTQNLQNLGFKIIEKPFSSIRQTLDLINQGRWIGSAEAYTLHEELLHSPQAKMLDKRVYRRLMTAKSITASQQIRLYQAQKIYQQQLSDELGGHILLMPTVAHVAPLLAPLEQDEELFAKVNLNTLRLTMIGSFLNMAIVAMPSGIGNFNLPTSVSLAGLQNTDKEVLQIAYQIEYCLR